MKKYLWVIGAIVIIVIAFAYFGTQNKVDSKGFNLGLISILSGEYAAVGQAFANGVTLANEQYNAANPDAKINLFIEDDGFTGGKGVSAYQKLVNVNKIDALINVSTVTIDSIYDTVTKAGFPVIQAGEQSIEAVDDNIFGIWPNSIDSSYDYGVYMRNKGLKEMTLVYTNHDAMIRFVEAFKKGFKGTTRDFKIPADEKDFRTHALKASDGNPATVSLFIFPQQGAQFIKEFLKVAKSKPQFFFDASFQSGFSDYERILGNMKVLDGTLVGTMNLPTTDEFKRDYKTRFSTDPGFFADVGYDAFNILIKSYSKDNQKWINNVKNIKMVGASGTTEFGPTGNRKPETKIMTVRDGKLVDL